MRFKIDWVSLIVGSKFPVFAFFYFVFEGNFPSTRPRGAYIWRGDLRCFDTVFQRPYRYFSIALKVSFSLSDRYEIFTSNWLWIEICENVVLTKIKITMTTINKNI